MIITIEDVVPLARYDNIPWTVAHIQEAIGPTGPWSTISTVALSPVDTNPSNPLPRNFTAESNLVDGWYRVVFEDATADQQLPTDPIQFEPSFAPTLSQVGEIALSRTVDDVGNVLGTFTSRTRPTDASARKLISRAYNDVIPEIGSDIPEDLWPKAANVIALRAAMLIELTLYANEIRNNLSPYPEYKALYEEELLKLKTEIMAEEAGQDPEDALGGTSPAFGFPAPDDLLTAEM